MSQHLGAGVAKLIKGVLRMAAISSLRAESKPVLGQDQTQVENVRKMLVSMVDDVRVGLIKLAEAYSSDKSCKKSSCWRKEINGC